ncbi:hypothetical protein BT69DRAFT_1329093 [Atractiella rhizophila]|nr:hypothetical protein BT69DRAFT_1329093 [Atractiella rhizophila]
MFLLLGLFAFLFLHAVAQATGANLLRNGDFESPLSDTDYAPWRCLYDNGVGLPKGNSSCCGVDTAGQFTFPATGESNLFFFQDCQIDQNATLVSGKSYRLKFFAYCVDCPSPSSPNLQITAGGVSMSNSVPNGTAQSGPYVQFTHAFEAKNANTLRLSWRGSGALRIDDVEMRELNGTPDGGLEDGSSATDVATQDGTKNGTDSAGGNLLINGDFEQSTTLAPWTCSSLDPTTGQASAASCCGVDQPSGDTFAASGNGNAFAFQNCFINQSLALNPGETYTLSYSAYVANGDNSAGNLAVALGGEQIKVDVASGSPSTGPYSQFQHTFTAVDSSPVQFLFTSAVGALRLDNIVLVSGSSTGSTNASSPSNTSNTTAIPNTSTSVIIPEGTNLLVNSDFEDGARLPPWTCSFAGSPNSTGCGIDQKGQDTFPNQGERNAFMFPNCSISQVVNLTLGVKYVVAFEAYCLDCTNAALGEKNGLTIKFGGEEATDEIAQGSPTSGDQYYHEITPKSNDPLEFLYTGTGAFRIDDVKLLVAPGPTANIGPNNGTSTGGGGTNNTTTTDGSSTQVDGRIGTDFLSNGDFEDGGTLVPWKCVDMATGATSTSCGVDLRDGSTTFPDSGDRNAFMTQGSSLTQTVQIGTAGNYFVTFAAYCVDCDDLQGANVQVNFGNDASFQQFVDSGPYGHFSKSVNLTTIGPMDISFGMVDHGFLRIDSIKVTLLEILDSSLITSNSQILLDADFETSPTLAPSWQCLRDSGNGNQCCGTDTAGDQTFPIGTRNAFIFQGCAIQQSVNIEPGMYLLSFSAYCFDCTPAKGNLVVELGGATFEDQATKGTIQAGPYSSYTHFVNVTTDDPLKISWTKEGGVRVDSFNLVSMATNPSGTNQFSPANPQETGSLTAGASKTLQWNGGLGLVLLATFWIF